MTRASKAPSQTWTFFGGDWLEGNPALIGPGMVFFAHMILMNSDAGAAYCLGRTYIIGDKGPEPVSRFPLEMITR